MVTNGDILDVAGSAGADAGTSYTFTCGKIDAGIAVLIGSHAHLIEFPSLLLPPGCTTGSIVNITCSRNLTAEQSSSTAFWDLQKSILSKFGTASPTPPQLRLRNATQTSVTLEWDRLALASSKLVSLAIWKNGSRVAAIPNPMNNLSTKLSGLDVDTEYTFHLVMKTTAGTWTSPIVKVRTHSLNDTSGINVCLGHISPPSLVDEIKSALEDLKARWTDKIQIDTTHFVCTSPSSSPTTPSGPRSSPSPMVEYQRALQLSIPVVQPSWVLACRDQQKMVSIGPHYLGNKAPPPSGSANPSATQLVGPSGAVRPTNRAAAPPSTLMRQHTASSSNASTERVTSPPPPGQIPGRMSQSSDATPNATTTSIPLAAPPPPKNGGPPPAAPSVAEVTDEMAEVELGEEGAREKVERAVEDASGDAEVGAES